jgi:hypothetical protein
MSANPLRANYPVNGCERMNKRAKHIRAGYFRAVILLDRFSRVGKSEAMAD